jgi:glycosyltransferase involved in cell wall biosynthesis
MNPSVTVVIPTYRRADLVVRAIASALRQTYEPLEIIVVSDGPDAATEEAVERLADPRVRLIVLSEKGGGCAARNAGIAAAAGKWMALLDDDDEWLPEKLAKQIAIVEESGLRHPIAACRVLVNRGISNEVWPTRPPAANEPLSEYIFCRSRMAQGEGLFITSMLLASRELLLQVPFRTDVARHQDTDWLLRATQVAGTGLVWAWEPLMIFNLEVTRTSVSRSPSALPSIQWERGNQLLTRKARGFFLATQVAPRIRLFAQPWLALRTIYEFFAKCRPTGKSLTLLVALMFTSPGFRNFLIARRGRKELLHKAA